MRSASRRSSSRPRTLESTMPTSSASTEPSQNQSTMRLTARPATRCAGFRGAVDECAVLQFVRQVALLFQAAQDGADGGVLQRTAKFLADLLGGDIAQPPDNGKNVAFELAELDGIVAGLSVTRHSVTDGNTQEG